MEGQAVTATSAVCPRHPKYRGEYSPTHGCVVCFALHRVVRGAKGNA